MIRYPISPDELRKRIEAHKPNWLKRAQKKTKAIATAGDNVSFPGIWSEIKQVYMSLQHSKCAYCERRLEGAIEHDVEHFRPKSEVSHWEPSAFLQREGLQLSQNQDASSEPGYRSLAYHEQNYMVACKSCNSVFKRSFFPIAGTRKHIAESPADATDEQPYLIFPIGDDGDDPEQLIGFEGPIPVTATNDRFRKLRAMVTIELLKLDNVLERKELLQGRAEAILNFYSQLKLSESSDPADATRGRINVQRGLAESSQFTSCLRSFYRTYQKDPDDAESIVDDVLYLLSKSSPI
jgi:5-methylcytosine-specific restriction endonuclease McrA